RIAQALMSEDASSLRSMLMLLAADNSLLNAEQAWGLLQAYYQALYDRSTDAVLTLDARARILAINTTGQMALGFPASALISTELSTLLESESGSSLVGLLWSGFEGVSDSVVVLKTGRRMRFSVSRFSDGIILLTLRDATRFFQLQEELQKSRGLANIGHLAADLAYGISNPLAVIQGRIQLLMADPDITQAKLQRYGTLLLGQCQRINSIIQNLQTVAAPQAPQHQNIQLSAAIQEAIGDLGSRQDRVQIAVQVEPSNLRINADPRQLRQALTNLLVLAVEATPKGRLVAISAVARGGEARILIEDEGKGLTNEQLDALKVAVADQRAMPDPVVGLPLAITWVLVREHGGWLQAENRPYIGARYQLSFPIKPPSQSIIPAREERCVLVVDDDRMLCDTVRWMLSSGGYSIVVVHSAEEAIQRIARQGFDAVITDIRLPGMHGEELVDTIEERWPELARRSILISGQAYNPRRNNPYLKKPFNQTQLLEVLRRVCP
ncbi:MAG: signal transduction histidine kinase/CheY-like chemotaxis protein, partial [Myxococcota bacterium]